MSNGIIDTTVIIHALRKYSNSREWIEAQAENKYVTTITWLEVMYGAPSKAGQRSARGLLERFNLLHIGTVEQEWAVAQMEKYRLSYGVSINDCLIASAAYRLQQPLYTHNLKDMRILLGDQLVVKPYD